MMMILKKGVRGEEVALLQRRLTRSGHPVEVSHIFDDATEAAVMAVQRAAGLVVDGIAGPKTFVALAGVKMAYHLEDKDLVSAAALLGVSLAAIRAVNEVASLGQGMQSDGRPVILFERHIFWRQLEQRGVDPAPLAERMPKLVAPAEGGYQGGAAEYVRLASARLVNVDAANESARWGAFQIMGYHWQELGYGSITEFVACMEESEAAQLDAFVRFIAQDPALMAALKGRKWTQFAKAYYGPDYARDLYDAKLAQAYAKYAEAEKAAA